MTKPGTIKSQRSWAENLRQWRRQSVVVGLMFAVAEGIESALPLRVPVLSGFLFCVLPGPYEMRNAWRARKALRKSEAGA